MKRPRLHTRILEGVAHLACHRYRLVLLVAGILTLLSLLPPFLIGMRFAFDITNMLPQSVSAARAFSRAVVDFGSADEAVVVFRLYEGMRSVPEAGRVAERIAERLRKDDRIKAAFCRKYNQKELDFLLEKELPRRGLLLLGRDNLEQVRQRLTPGQIRKSVYLARRRLTDLGASRSKTGKLIAHDVLGILSIFQRELKTFGKGKKEGEDPAADSAKGYIVAEIDEEKRQHIKDGARALLLLVIQPKQPAQSARFSREIMTTIRRTTEEEVARNLSPAARQSIHVEYGGGYEITSRYRSRVNKTLLSTLIVSLIGVVVLFGYCFRRYGVLLYIGVPLVMIVSWTIGLGWIIFGQLNIVSCAFAAVLVGLGVDYAIHIYNRYVEERAQGCSVDEAFSISLVHTGWAVLIGMVTTSLAFLALKATRFTQLSEFGVLAGLGIALSVPGMLFVLPALIAWRNERKPEHPRTLQPTQFFLPQIANLVENRRRWVLVVALVALVASGLRLHLGSEALLFDKRLSSLRPKERAFVLGGEIARVFSNRNPNKLMLLVYGETERDALELAARLEDGCKQLQQEGRLVDYESVMRYLPAPSLQQESLRIIKTMDFAGALATFRQELDRQGLSEETFELTVRLLQQHAELAKQDDAVILPSDFYDTPLGKWARRLVTRRRQRLDLRDPLPASLTFPVVLAKPAVDRNGRVRVPAGAALTREDVLLIGPGGKDEKRTDPKTGKPVEYTWVKRITALAPGWTVKANVYPPILAGSHTADLNIDAEWLDAVRTRLHLRREDADGQNTGGFLTGTSLLAQELAEVVKDDFWRVSWAVFGIAVLVLAVFFHRHPVRAFYCLLPIVFGLMFLFGIMSFFRIPFNFINVLAIPIIIGLGVDNGIHLVNRFYEAGRRVRPVIADTGRAIMITTLTSIIGFGSLAVGGYEGITSMGTLSILALASSLMASLVVFPAVLRTFSPPETAPEDPDLDQD